MLDCDGKLRGAGVWIKRPKRRKRAKSGDVRPIFADYLDFLVVVRKGCAKFGVLKSRMCGCNLAFAFYTYPRSYTPVLYLLYSIGMVLSGYKHVRSEK